jgi:predicted ABC-type sugar transport system permease subunit
MVRSGTPDAIAAVIIGGTSIMGGRGNFLGAAGGAMLLTTFSTVISAFRIPEGWRMIVYGSIILLALLAFPRRLPAAQGAYWFGTARYDIRKAQINPSFNFFAKITV